MKTYFGRCPFCPEQDVKRLYFITKNFKEVFSLIENAGLMGVPIPAVLTKAIDVLKNRENGGTKDE